MVTKKSRTSGARSFISVSVVSHLNSTRDLGFLKGSHKTDGWPVVLTQLFTLRVNIFQKHIFYCISQKRNFHYCLGDLVWISRLRGNNDRLTVFWRQQISPSRKLEMVLSQGKIHHEIKKNHHKNTLETMNT